MARRTAASLAPVSRSVVAGCLTSFLLAKARNHGQAREDHPDHRRRARHRPRLRHLLAARGYSLSLLDQKADDLAQLVDEIKEYSPHVSGVAADVRDRDALFEAVRQLETRVGPTDVLLACAGIGTLSSVQNMDTDGLRRMLDVNVLGVALSIEAVLPGMIERQSGHILGMSSVAGFRGLPWMPGYSASKAALSAYLEGLRPAFKIRGIRITTVCPGFVRTDMTAKTPFRKPVSMLTPEQACALHRPCYQETPA